MNIIGISCHYHDSAACLIQDGKVVAAIQEERLTRKKNTSDFPINAINYCVKAGGISFDDIHHIAFYEKPFLKFSRVIINHLLAWPFSFKNFMDTMPYWLQDRLVLPMVLEREMGYTGPVHFVKHHLSHAASAFLVSPFEGAAIITSDAVGEWATMAYGHARGIQISLTQEMRYPHSLGLVYTAVTTYLGYAAHEGEGTVMALASCGKPVYLDKFKDIVKVFADGSFMVNPRFFAFNRGDRMYTPNFIKMFGAPRAYGQPVEERHCDIAASLQKFTEEVLLNVTRHVHQRTGLDKLCLAGGLFLNCVANSKILEDGRFKEIFIQPAAGDSGGALGAAAYVNHVILKQPRKFVLTDAYLGTEFPDSQIRQSVISAGLPYDELDDELLFKRVAQYIADNKVVGWLQGRMEFGPRALGNRSILGNPCNPNMKEILNEKVKKREPFRPYAPVVLEEKLKDYFVLGTPSPFMLLAPQVRDDKRSVIPGIVHVDGSARVQSVNQQDNARLYELIREFEKLTGVPVIINTSFNLRGEPVVSSPEDAINCFRKSSMDVLVLGNLLITRAS